MSDWALYVGFFAAGVLFERFVVSTFLTFLWDRTKFERRRTRADLLRILECIEREIHLLYLWHEPDERGVQSWRNPQDDAAPKND